MSNKSSLTSVVSVPEHVKKWERIDDHDPLAQLHSRFWGTSMREEEEAWRAKERLSPAASNDNRKPNEKLGNGTNEGEDIIVDPSPPCHPRAKSGGGGGGGGGGSTSGKGKQRETLPPVPPEAPGDGNGDDNDNDNDDDDTIPGCYVLDFNNDGIGIKRIWVRAEYIRIYDYLVEYYDQNTSLNGTAPSAVVTGQPSIGKSVLLCYVLRRCLAERRPVIWFYRRAPFLFAEDGVYLMHADFQLAHYKRILWTLVDTDKSLTGIPEVFVTQYTPFFVVWPTSQAKEHWSRLKKTTCNAVIVMNPWTRGEIHRVAKLYSNALDSKLIDDIYDRFGPIPRLCIQTASDSKALATHEHDTRTALRMLIPWGLQELISKLQALRVDTESQYSLCQHVYLVKRQNIGDVGSMPYVTHITDHMRSRIAIHMRNLDSLQQVNLYHTLDCTPSRGAAGHIFESFFQQHFQRRIFINFVPMVRLTGHDGQCKHQWHTSHHPVEDQKLEKSRQNALRRMVTLDIYPSNIHEYSDQDVQGLILTPDVYYIPSTQNAAAIDSFVYHGGYLYLLHFTTSQEHKIDLKFMSRFTQYANFPPRSTWRLIFIVPDDAEVLTCPYSRSSETVKLFSSKVNMEDYLEVVRSKEREEKEDPPHKKQKRT